MNGIFQLLMVNDFLDGPGQNAVYILGLRPYKPAQIHVAKKIQLLDSMFSLYGVYDAKSDVIAYLIKPQSIVRYGGNFLLAGSGAFKELQSADTVLKTRELVVYNSPGLASLAISTRMNDSMQAIIEEQ